MTASVVCVSVTHPPAKLKKFPERLLYLVAGQVGRASGPLGTAI
jgi:hypothetical protein